MDGEGGGSVAIDLNHVSEGTLGQEGTIILTGEDGSQSKSPLGGNKMSFVIYMGLYVCLWEILSGNLKLPFQFSLN